MFRIKNKKGFTLVELMIVVVILGILVAIAVPIFNSVTKNAKKKSCQSNMRVMLGIAIQIGTDNDGDYGKILNSGTFNVGQSINLTTNSADLSSEFLGSIKGGAVPECPDEGEYTLARTSENGVNITCSVDYHN
jgi:prepilin-type N-terminal cleavage/methylation domain-containing protein